MWKADCAEVADFASKHQRVTAKCGTKQCNEIQWLKTSRWHALLSSAYHPAPVLYSRTTACPKRAPNMPQTCHKSIPQTRVPNVFQTRALKVPKRSPSPYPKPVPQMCLKSIPQTHAPDGPPTCPKSIPQIRAPSPYPKSMPQVRSKPVPQIHAPNTTQTCPKRAPTMQDTHALPPGVSAAASALRQQQVLE